MTHIINDLEEIMTEKLELYKCHICGNIVQVIINGIGELVCCGEKMEHIIPHKDEHNEYAEKHTPNIENIEDEKFVIIKNHPMNPEHHIQFIEAYTKDKKELHLKYLNPNEPAIMNINCFNEEIIALENCNIHGLWTNN